MKIRINPMGQLLKRAERRINFFCAAKPQDLAHDRKRQMAQQVLAGGVPSAEFTKAAMIEGLTVLGLADLILSKPDVLMEAENKRRTLIVKARAATTADELNRVLIENGVPEHFEDIALDIQDDRR